MSKKTTFSNTLLHLTVINIYHFQNVMKVPSSTYMYTKDFGKDTRYIYVLYKFQRKKLFIYAADSIEVLIKLHKGASKIL